MPLDAMQKVTIYGFLCFPFNAIKEFEFDERVFFHGGIEDGKALKAFTLILSDKLLTPSQRFTLEEWGVLGDVEGIRKVLAHPAPQNRSIDSFDIDPEADYIDLPTYDPVNQVIYEGSDEELHIETRGLFNLDSRSYDPKSPATKDDVVNYITWEVKRRIEAMEAQGVKAFTAEEVAGGLDNERARIFIAVNPDMFGELADMDYIKFANACYVSKNDILRAFFAENLNMFNCIADVTMRRFLDICGILEDEQNRAIVTKNMEKFTEIICLDKDEEFYEACNSGCFAGVLTILTKHPVEFPEEYLNEEYLKGNAGRHVCLRRVFNDDDARDFILTNLDKVEPFLKADDDKFYAFCYILRNESVRAFITANPDIYTVIAGMHCGKFISTCYILNDESTRAFIVENPDLFAELMKLEEFRFCKVCDLLHNKDNRALIIENPDLFAEIMKLGKFHFLEVYNLLRDNNKDILAFIIEDQDRFAKLIKEERFRFREVCYFLKNKGTRALITENPDLFAEIMKLEEFRFLEVCDFLHNKNIRAFIIANPSMLTELTKLMQLDQEEKGFILRVFQDDEARAFIIANPEMLVRIINLDRKRLNSDRTSLTFILYALKNDYARAWITKKPNLFAKIIAMDCGAQHLYVIFHLHGNIRCIVDVNPGMIYDLLNVKDDEFDRVRSILNAKKGIDFLIAKPDILEQLLNMNESAFNRACKILEDKNLSTFLIENPNNFNVFVEMDDEDLYRACWVFRDDSIREFTAKNLPIFLELVNMGDKILMNAYKIFLNEEYLKIFVCAYPNTVIHIANLYLNHEYCMRQAFENTNIRSFMFSRFGWKMRKTDILDFIVKLGVDELTHIGEVLSNEGIKAFLFEQPNMFCQFMEMSEDERAYVSKFLRHKSIRDFIAENLIKLIKIVTLDVGGSGMEEKKGMVRICDAMNHKGVGDFIAENPENLEEFYRILDCYRTENGGRNALEQACKVLSNEGIKAFLLKNPGVLSMFMNMDEAGFEQACEVFDNEKHRASIIANPAMLHEFLCSNDEQLRGGALVGGDCLSVTNLSVEFDPNRSGESHGM